MLENLHILWAPIIGISLIVYGIHLFLDIQEMEIARQTVRMKKTFEVIYNVGGKYTILDIFEILCIAILISGIQ